MKFDLYEKEIGKVKFLKEKMKFEYARE